MIPSGWAALLLAVTLVAGVAIGWAVCMWMTPDHCEDCPEGGGYGDGLRQAAVSERAIGEDRADEYPAGRQEHAAEERTASLSLPGLQGLASDLAFWDDTVSNETLLDVPRPELTPLDVPGPGHHAGPLWLETALMGIEARYPIPGTPQWEARQVAA